MPLVHAAGARPGTQNEQAETGARRGKSRGYQPKHSVVGEDCRGGTSQIWDWKNFPAEVDFQRKTALAA
ncbi:hypothetical protein E2C01_022742 [Portunus trituberculatus]|uniref:Uncharacterized protein n=1 Tax=Portunus trituberculatus TaxID=210409 RepID=A0A5B7E838_PORTR|nr:hypothetical protein [Portunus trituberculatus]